MKNIKKLLLVFFVSAAYLSNGQIDIEGTLKAGPQDAQTYFENYMVYQIGRMSPLQIWHLAEPMLPTD